MGNSGSSSAWQRNLPFNSERLVSDLQLASDLWNKHDRDRDSKLNRDELRGFISELSSHLKISLKPDQVTYATTTIFRNVENGLLSFEKLFGPRPPPAAAPSRPAPELPPKKQQPQPQQPQQQAQQQQAGSLWRQNQLSIDPGLGGRGRSDSVSLAALAPAAPRPVPPPQRNTSSARESQLARSLPVTPRTRAGLAPSPQPQQPSTPGISQRLMRLFRSDSDAAAAPREYDLERLLANPKQLKRAGRLGFPPHQRAEIWLQLARRSLQGKNAIAAGGSGFSLSLGGSGNPQARAGPEKPIVSYERLVTHLFPETGGHLPSYFPPALVPLFGSAVSWEQLKERGGKVSIASTVTQRGIRRKSSLGMAAPPQGGPGSPATEPPGSPAGSLDAQDGSAAASAAASGASSSASSSGAGSTGSGASSPGASGGAGHSGTPSAAASAASSEAGDAPRRRKRLSSCASRGSSVADGIEDHLVGERAEEDAERAELLQEEEEADDDSLAGGAGLDRPVSEDEDEEVEVEIPALLVDHAHIVSPSVLNEVKEILCVLGSEFPSMRFAPPLVDLLLFLLIPEHSEHWGCLDDHHDHDRPRGFVRLGTAVRDTFADGDMNDAAGGDLAAAQAPFPLAFGPSSASSASSASAPFSSASAALAGDAFGSAEAGTVAVLNPGESSPRLRPAAAAAATRRYESLGPAGAAEAAARLARNPAVRSLMFATGDSSQTLPAAPRQAQPLLFDSLPVAMHDAEYRVHQNSLLHNIMLPPASSERAPRPREGSMLAGGRAASGPGSFREPDSGVLAQNPMLELQLAGAGALSPSSADPSPQQQLQPQAPGQQQRQQLSQQQQQQLSQQQLGADRAPHLSSPVLRRGASEPEPEKVRSLSLASEHEYSRRFFAHRELWRRENHLHHFNRDEAFYIARAMCELDTRYSFPTHHTEFVRHCHTFGSLLRSVLPLLDHHLSHVVGMDVREELFKPWYSSLFIPYFPPAMVQRILDAFFVEGHKIIFRYALAVCRHFRHLLLEARSPEEVHRSLEYAMHCCDDPQSINAISRLAFQFGIRRKQMAQLDSEHQDSALISPQLAPRDRSKGASRSKEEGLRPRSVSVANPGSGNGAAEAPLSVLDEMERKQQQEDAEAPAPDMRLRISRSLDRQKLRLRQQAHRAVFVIPKLEAPPAEVLLGKGIAPPAAQEDADEEEAAGAGGEGSGARASSLAVTAQDLEAAAAAAASAAIEAQRKRDERARQRERDLALMEASQRAELMLRDQAPLRPFRTLMDHERLLWLWSWIPSNLRLRHPRLLFSTLALGDPLRLSALLDRFEDDQGLGALPRDSWGRVSTDQEEVPSVMLVQDMHYNVFGVFSAFSWRRAHAIHSLAAAQQAGTLAFQSPAGGAGRGGRKAEGPSVSYTKGFKRGALRSLRHGLFVFQFRSSAEDSELQQRLVDDFVSAASASSGAVSSAVSAGGLPSPASSGASFGGSPASAPPNSLPGGPPPPFHPLPQPGAAGAAQLFEDECLKLDLDLHPDSEFRRNLSFHIGDGDPGDSPEKLQDRLEAIRMKDGGAVLVRCDDEALSVGDRDGQAIEIDAELRHGYSQHTEVFSNPCLSRSAREGGKFDILHVEVWTLLA